MDGLRLRVDRLQHRDQRQERNHPPERTRRLADRAPERVRHVALACIPAPVRHLAKRKIRLVDETHSLLPPAAANIAPRRHAELPLEPARKVKPAHRGDSSKLLRRNSSMDVAIDERTDSAFSIVAITAPWANLVATARVQFSSPHD